MKIRNQGTRITIEKAGKRSLPAHQGNAITAENGNSQGDPCVSLLFFLCCSHPRQLFRKDNPEGGEL